VCRGDGHTEAIQVTFDKTVVSYEQLLRKFASDHSMTYKSKPQYKSAIYFNSSDQQRAAATLVAAKGKRCVTQVLPLGPWWDAEEYHQKYYEKNMSGGFCRR